MRNHAYAALFFVLFASSGCGEDEPPPPPPRSNRARPAPTPAAGQRGGPAGTPEQLTTYRKVEDVVSPDEARSIRHVFKPNDFVNDPSGTASRDPFRSYVVAQVSASSQAASADATTAKSEKCANKKIAAAGYTTQELRLIGIVSRGTVRFATFSDTANVGWVVKRGDCIGSEHARVKLIGEAFVTLEYPGVTPPPGTTGTGAAAEAPRVGEREYQLYPKELSTESEDEEDPRTRRRPPRLGDIPVRPDEMPVPTTGDEP